ncbi:unnamed protein product (macronuclear) [Paramecium tetraurelia]|uniref:Uncharacterized protein n=1 Tax=Paramecium tetraurelia TaxID=5888 RepID=A0DTD4_PARTE|nr:uncharacterized protein GSPATT00039757001 [Paramecium tetraurelia]CAK86301.1 unnamed protein product [Paramecium tetraurelia]|eukprot:XP_001453698.1 hypothetical protein (macronuclear) [Paramecium tetraurelia strain d4-2]
MAQQGGEWLVSRITSGYCAQFCVLCLVPFKCETCQSGYYLYKDGSCTSNCNFPYQKLSGSQCQNYDDETPYSQYLVEENENSAGDPEQYALYTLVSQSGSNFLKGSDIYFSYWFGNRIFGGPFVWAQAKFQRVHNIISPHHSVTIGFYIVYGPLFPLDGNFIYTIESNEPVSKSTASASAGSVKYEKIYEKINHSTNTLTITWECFGQNNEPVKAYCGFYRYYIAVHYCQPYCLQCSNQTTCTSWNSTYDSNIVKFSQAECLIVQLVHHLVQLVDLNQIVKHVNQLIPNLNQDVFVQQINIKIQINVQIVQLNVINVQVLLTVQNAQLLIEDNYPMGNVFVLTDIILLFQQVNVSHVINFAKLVLDQLLMNVQLAMILLILNKQDQHVDVQQGCLINIQQKVVPLVIHHAQHALEPQLMAVQHVILLQIEYQKGQNVFVHLVIMNQVMFVQIVQLQKIHLLANVINCVIIIN